MDGEGNVYSATQDGLANVELGGTPTVVQLQNLVKWNPSTSTLTTLVPGVAIGVNGLATDSVGNVYFSDSISGTVKKW